jgi:hypothetical protein
MSHISFPPTRLDFCKEKSLDECAHFGVILEFGISFPHFLGVSTCILAHLVKAR